jgi:hypothetical protein
LNDFFEELRLAVVFFEDVLARAIL